MRPTLVGIALLASVGCVCDAAAGERYGYGSYPDAYGAVEAYGYAGGLIGGDYIGAPLTRVPRTNEIVPPAWGYGTYGVPTVTGIRQAPTAAPTLTVINGVGPAMQRKSLGARVVSRRTDGRWASNVRTVEPNRGDVRLLSVTVPRR